MKRRVFIKKSCTACMLGMAALVMPTLVSSASAKEKKRKPYKTELTENNEIIIPISLFVDTKMQIVTVKGWDFDIAVIQKEDLSFNVFLLKCTHMDNALKSAPEGFTCSLHGSSYNLMGDVTQGPAEKSLEQYKAIQKEENIIITAT
jgi:Rieske Fe-S protein